MCVCICMCVFVYIHTMRAVSRLECISRARVSHTPSQSHTHRLTTTHSNACRVALRMYLLPRVFVYTNIECVSCHAQNMFRVAHRMRLTIYVMCDTLASCRISTRTRIDTCVCVWVCMCWKDIHLCVYTYNGCIYYTYILIYIYISCIYISYYVHIYRIPTWTRIDACVCVRVYKGHSYVCLHI